MRPAFRTLLLVALLAVLVGCGAKGPLVPPGDEPGGPEPTAR